MSETISNDTSVLLALTSDIVSSHVANNEIAGEQLPSLIKSVYDALANVGASEPEPEKLVPAVPVKRSVFPDHIICLEDGKKLKMLKRHLMSAYNMTPDEYRARWGLPADYPMVAPSYAEKRSQLAQEIGLGRKISAHSEDDVQVTKVPEARRGRKRTAG